jgi:hypothetical protein
VFDCEDDVDVVAVIEGCEGWGSFCCWREECDGVFVEDEGVWDVVGIA